MFIWFRDDDVSVNSEKLNTLIKYFLEKRTDILMAVIPNSVEEETIKVIRENNRLIVGQHGFCHINYSVGDEPKSEFPKSRPYESALAELELGRKMIKKLFPENYADVFVPPYFEIDDSILKRISGWYKWFSCWWTNSINEDNCVFVNAQVDFVNWDTIKEYGGSRYVEEQVLRELTLLDELPYSATVIGVVLHHDYCETDSYQELDWFFSLPEQYKNVYIISPKQAYDFVCSKKVLIYCRDY